MVADALFMGPLGVSVSKGSSCQPVNTSHPWHGISHPPINSSRSVTRQANSSARLITLKNVSFV